MPDEDPSQLLSKITRLTKLMDEAYQIPGTRIRVGLDSLIGVIPGIGDLATGLISLYIVWLAQKSDLPRHLLWRMFGNIGLDTLLGSVPLLGDIGDVFFKSNRRNLRILHQHLKQRQHISSPKTPADAE